MCKLVGKLHNKKEQPEVDDRKRERKNQNEMKREIEKMKWIKVLANG